MTIQSTQATDDTLNTHADVVVIGGGLVGASLAVALGQLGIDTLVLEAHPPGDQAQPSFDERTVALTLVSERIFTGLGVWPHVANEATAIESIHVSDRGHFGSTRLTCRDAGTPALGYVIANRALGQGLYASLAQHTSVRVISPATVTQISRPENESASAGAYAHVHSNVGTFSTQLVIIADGGRSALTQSAGLHSQEKTYQQRALVTRAGSEKPHNNRAFERFTSAGPLALLPVDEHDYAVAWTLNPADAEHTQSLDEPAFLKALQAAFGERAGRFTKAAPRHVYPLSLATLTSPVAPQLAVVGNAAHTVHPVAGQGFNLGLRDVATLATLLGEAKDAALPLGDASVLSRYARARRSDTQAVSWFTDGLIRTFTQSALPVVVARNLLLSGLNLLPTVRRGLLHRTMGLRGQTSALTRGRALPQPVSQPGKSL